MFDPGNVSGWVFKYTFPCFCWIATVVLKDQTRILWFVSNLELDLDDFKISDGVRALSQNSKTISEGQRGDTRI